MLIPNIPTLEAKKTQIDKVTITAYNAEQRQTDKTPNITASHFRLERKHDKKIIALSRDLAKKYEFGDKFYLCYEYECINVEFQDRMNRRFAKKVDLLMYSGAKEFGIKKGYLIRRD